jgi:dTDP-glucose 4,6-dehydratase
VVVTRGSNTYGPYQLPEKLIPLALTRAESGEPIPLYGDGQQTREWLHVEDHCRGLLLALDRGQPGEVYNLGGGEARTNLALVESLLDLLGRPRSLIRFIEDRPGHDRRYALDSAKARDALGFLPRRRLDEELAQTVRWYRENAAWIARVTSGEYRYYFERQYRHRLEQAP